MTEYFPAAFVVSFASVSELLVAPEMVLLLASFTPFFSH